MSQLATYIESLRYLKPVQIFGRASMLTRRKILHRLNAYNARYVRHSNEPLRIRPIAFPKQDHPPIQIDDLMSGTFTFLNRRVNLGQPVDWFPEGETQLWRYNLHYFDIAVLLGHAFATNHDKAIYDLFRTLVCDWIQHCPVAAPVAWDPYPISLRLSNWIKAYTLFEAELRHDPSFTQDLLGSLYVQAKFLEKNLEHHLLGNHLIENGRALLLAGLFFTDSAADRWRQKGEKILWHELEEQFLDDGGHFELSPMYHQIMLDLYEEVVAVLKSRNHPVPHKATERIQRMQTWLQAVVHPDQQISLLNDSAFGIAGPRRHNSKTYRRYQPGCMLLAIVVTSSLMTLPPKII